jgi:small subunit ribosomal protein S15
MSGFEAEELAARAEVISKFRRSEKDVGSPEVQVALITQRLDVLTKHSSANRKDHHSQRGMMKLISRRKRLLAYLKREDSARYKTTIDTLGLRK